MVDGILFSVKMRNAIPVRNYMDVQ